MAFANDGCAVGPHRNPHPGSIDCKERPSIFTCEHTAGLDRLSIPAVKAKDSVGFRDRVPAFNIGELAPIGLACADIAVVEIAPERFDLFCREAHFVLTLRNGSGLERATPSISDPSLSSLIKTWRFNRGSPGCQ